jgi:hypothetical protein
MVAVATTFAPSSSVALAAPEVSQICTGFIEPFVENVLEIDITHGTCVSVVQAFVNKGNAEPVGLCKVIQILVEQESYGTVTFPLGRCVSEVRQGCYLP